MLPIETRQPAVYHLVTRLVLTVREPYRTEVRRLCPGDRLWLSPDAEKEPGSRTIWVVNSQNQAVGHLSADVASYVSILLDNAPDIIDESFAESILQAAPPDDPAARRLRYPKLFLHMRLRLTSAWPLFTIAAVLGLKTQDFDVRFNLADNTWLSPLRQLHEEYRQAGHDQFRLPPEIVESWMAMTRRIRRPSSMIPPEREAVIRHYDALVDENNDPARDPDLPREYMDKWDGPAFIDEMQLSPAKSVLEVGVGTGRVAQRVCGRCRRFTGIDFSPKTIARAKDNLFGNLDVCLICDDFMSHPFDEKFDIIYSTLTFLHIKDKQSAICKVSSLLHDGGRFVLSISKDPADKLDFGSRVIPLHPDDAAETAWLIAVSGLQIEKQFETEFAVIFTAVKHGG
jgi:SAM-dependent methyltransferase